MEVEKRQVLVGENLLYFLLWAAVLLVPVMAPKMLGGEQVIFENVIVSWQKVVPYLVLFVVNNWLLAPYLLFKKRYAFYVIATLLVISIIFGAVDIYGRQLVAGVSDVEQMIQRRKASFTDLALPWNILLGIFMALANTMIKLLYKSISDMQEMEALKRENMQAEIDYLKYQINPHFFMNTLNNIHALIDIAPKEAQATVIELSKMMRYILYDSEQRSISLEQDIRFMEHYIRLMRIRYSEELDVRIDYPSDEVSKVKIPPLLLIVFVENAFKHGIASVRHPFIHIGVELPEGKVRCTITNSRSPKSDDTHPGIGLKNVKTRLELIFGSDYTLDIRDGQEAYVVQLTIPQYD